MTLASNVPSLPPVAARRHCGIPEEDLLRVDLSDNRKLHLPGYIIAVDHATRSVVLSVRGTFSMQDTVTDLVCDSAGERDRETRTLVQCSSYYTVQS